MGPRRIVDATWIVCSLAALTCFVIGMGRSVGSIPNRLDYKVVHDLGSLIALEERDLSVPVTNPTREAVTIVGSEGHCGLGFCVDLMEAPIVIPPSGRAKLRIRVRVSDMPGVYSDTLKVFSTAPGQPELILNFTGQILQPPPN